MNLAELGVDDRGRAGRRNFTDRSAARAPRRGRRKIILVSKIAIGAGVALPLLMMLGLFEPDQLAIGAIAAVLGGIVSLGSNVSTLRQTNAAISDAEKSRSDLIGRINLRVVGGRDVMAQNGLGAEPHDGGYLH
jgi:hypothetical protein